MSRLRARRNPIPARDESYVLDPYHWIEGTVLEDYCPEDEAGFFHVTTNLRKVFQDGRLRSRSDVGIVGLGGGQIDPGNHVSFVVSRSRAVWLFEAMRGLIIACRDGSAADVLRLVLDWTGFPGDTWSFNWDEDDEDDDLSGAAWDNLGDLCAELNVEPPDDIQALAYRGPWDEMLARERQSLEARWGKNATTRYELAQFFELRLESAFYIPEWWDDGTCVPLVGFTASAPKFVRLDPNEVSIVQAAVSTGQSYAEMIPRECELRFSPENIQIVAVRCEDERNVIPVPSRFE